MIDRETSIKFRSIYSYFWLCIYKNDFSFLFRKVTQKSFLDIRNKLCLKHNFSILIHGAITFIFVMVIISYAIKKQI